MACSRFNIILMSLLATGIAQQAKAKVSGLSLSENSGIITASYSYPNEPNQRPVINDVTITGTRQEGETLTLVIDAETRSRSPLDPDNYIIQWYRSDDIKGTNRTAISGATGNTYDQVAADVNKSLDGEVVVAVEEGLNKTSEPYITRPTELIAAAASPNIVHINFRRNADPAGVAKAPATAINEITHTSLTVADCVNINGEATGSGATLSNVGGLPGLPNGDLTGNTTIFSDESADTHLNAQKTAGAETLTIDSLDDAKTYAIEFLGTESAGAAAFNRIGTITAGGASGTDVSSGTYDGYQQTATVRLEGLNTDGAGNLIVVFTSTGTAGANNWLPMNSIAWEEES